MFQNRRSAGKPLALALMKYSGQAPLVIGLPRGGVPVAFEVAQALKAPLDVFMVRKIGAPGQPELAVAAISEGNPPHMVRNREIIAQLGISETYLEGAAADLIPSMAKRRALFGAGEAPPCFEGRTVILVDDGIATGATIKASLEAIRTKGAEYVCVAVPVMPPQLVPEIEKLADDLVCLEQPTSFRAVGVYYRDFPQTDCDEVKQLLVANRLGYQASE